ncbi:MAG: hypothetical protein ACFB5Z_01230 [Elainellaceae cyanobacterium]
MTLTLWGLFGWAVSAIIGVMIGESLQGLLWLGVVFSTMIAALLVSQQLLPPVVWFINSRRKSASLDYLVGCTGIVSSDSLSTLTEGDMAQVDVVDPTGSTLTINAALPIWATVVPHQGDRVTLVERATEMGLYYAVASDSADQDRWLRRTAAI